jgi:hypothetical protein
MRVDELLALDPDGRGPRPRFHADPAIERVLDVALALAQELAVTRQRLDALERLLAARGVVGPSDVDAFEPDAEASAVRERWQREYLKRVLQSLLQE